MKAYSLHQIGDIRLEEVDKPTAGEQDVIVKVQAVGICGSDIPRIYYTGTYSYPLIPGHEFSGEVVEVGADADSSLLGKRVGVFPLIPCRECEPCRHQQYELCRHYSYLGSRTAGGFAEYVRVPQWNLFPLPEQVSYEQAAMLEPMCVAVHAIRRAQYIGRYCATSSALRARGIPHLSMMKMMTGITAWNGWLQAGFIRNNISRISCRFGG